MKWTSRTLRGCVDWNLCRSANDGLIKSHPTWVRGLKHNTIVDLKKLICRTLRGCVDWNEEKRNATLFPVRSHPTWVRGLKRNLKHSNIILHEVAPYVGAWIETFWWFLFTNVLSVAPYVGAWIETQDMWNIFNDWESHPTWVRGLKHSYKFNRQTHYQSHPTWVRGLKLHHYLNGPKWAGRTLRGCVDWNIEFRKFCS